MISEATAAFIDAGVTASVATRSADLVPDCMLAVAARVAPDRRHVTVFLPAATATIAARNLADNGAIAVTFSRTSDNRTLQVKGRAVSVRPAADALRPTVEAYFANLAGSLERVGYPPRLVRRVAVWPCLAVEVAVEALYVPTPGPRAGSPR